MKLNFLTLNNNQGSVCSLKEELNYNFSRNQNEEETRNVTL